MPQSAVIMNISIPAVQSTKRNRASRTLLHRRRAATLHSIMKPIRAATGTAVKPAMIWALSPEAAASAARLHRGMRHWSLSR